MFKRGFTLVEILIVLALVAVLSTLAVGGYVQYRQSVLVDLTADEIISQFYELKTRAQYGSLQGKRLDQIVAELEGGAAAEAVSESLRCYGMYFPSTENGFKIQTFVQDFSSEKVYDRVVDAWIYSGCDFDAGKDRLTDLEIDNAVKVVAISGDDGVSRGNFAVLFLPPDGRLEQIGGSEKLFIELNYADDRDSKKVIEINLTNGNAQVQKSS